jgi:hypothetical protein
MRRSSRQLDQYVGDGISSAHDSVRRDIETRARGDCQKGGKPATMKLTIGFDTPSCRSKSDLGSYKHPVMVKVITIQTNIDIVRDNTD